MSSRSRELTSQLKAFQHRLLNFLRGLDESTLDRILPEEGFSIRTVAAHISGPRHFGMHIHMRRFLEGDLPADLDPAQVTARARLDMATRRDWETPRVLESLERECARMVEFVASLSDDDLARSARLKRFGGVVTLEQAIEWIVIGTSVEHLENMKRKVF